MVLLPPSTNDDITASGINGRINGNTSHGGNGIKINNDGEDSTNDGFISLTFFVDNDNGNDTTQDGNKENGNNNNNSKNINRFLQTRLPSSAKKKRGREKG